MSSLVGYHEGLPSFQQLPFAINLGGVPVWCGFGGVGTGGMSCLGNPEAGKELSTARMIPRIRQEENRLVAVYTSSSGWMTMSTLRLRPQMYWAEDQFDEHGVFGRWTWARKGTAVMAYRIQGMRVYILVDDLQASSISLETFLQSLLTP